MGEAHISENLRPCPTGGDDDLAATPVSELALAPWFRITLQVHGFRPVNGMTRSVKSRVGMNAGRCGIDRLQTPFLRHHHGNQALDCIYRHREIGIAGALCICATATGCS